MPALKSPIYKEKIVYWFILLLMMFSMFGAGLGFVRYSVYFIPLIVIVLWLFLGRGRIEVTRQTAPFVFLLAVISLNIYYIDYLWAKKAYFIFTYVIVFTCFDLSKAKFNDKIFNIIFIFVYGVSLIAGGGSISLQDLGEALYSSKWQFESTFAFPLGLFAVYFLVKKEYLWFVVNVFLALLAFKRIVMLGIAVPVLLFLMPRFLSRKLVNPWFVTAVVLALMVLIIEVAGGTFDKVIVDSLNMSANQLLMGRQALWSDALHSVDFSHFGFLLHGVGHSEVSRQLLIQHSGREVLLHGDFFLVLLEHGYLALAVFTFLLMRQKSFEEKLLAVYLAIVFLTDNVLIYQHVMLPFLLLMAKLREQNRVGNEYMAANPLHKFGARRI